MPAHFAALRPELPLWKRATDLICCALAVPVFAAAAAAMSILMALYSPGPLFFTQERIGYRGRRFKLYKFRTMHVTAQTAAHQDYVAGLVHSSAPMQKLDARGDSRVIPGGWLIRALGLDELPQLINVWRAEMSVVGPRPCIPYEYEEYGPAQRARFDAMPGLTGLWQVSGKNRTTFAEMIAFDVEYAARKSFWLDLKIVLLTPVALVTQLADTRRGRRSVRSTSPAVPGSAEILSNPL